ncbi:MAG: hypothetical protein HY326_06020, partial [Chloroflexi bacterium]|nr:hypothetical protein [Chloroflexota bacterium]
DGYDTSPSEINFTCLATSRDGFHWEKPHLGLVEFRGSRDNNILPNEYLMPYWFLDPHEEDPARRYKGLIRTGTTKTPGMTFDLYYSPDSFHWTPYAHNPVINTAPKVGRWGPTKFMGWDPIRQVYAVHMENCHHRNTPLRKRLIGRAESPDMIHWSEPETIILPDEKDPPDMEFYMLDVTTYAGLYVGLLWNFRTNKATHEPELIFSRDGIHYERNYRQPFVARGPKGAFDSTSVFTSVPIFHENQILVHYSGRNWRSIDTLVEMEGNGTSMIGLATLPMDGLIAIDGAKGRFSELVTRSFSFTGNSLFVNVASALQNAWGAGPCEVRVEILEPDHEFISGFTFQDADPITATNTAHVATWQGRSDLSALAGRTIKLRFYIKDARLYSFQFR